MPRAKVSVGLRSEVTAQLLPKICLSVDASGLPGDFVHPFHRLWNQSPDV